jgi:hypothetical protein
MSNFMTKYYAEGIQKFERQLGHAVSSFSDILKVVQQPLQKNKLTVNLRRCN